MVAGHLTRLREVEYLRSELCVKIPVRIMISRKNPPMIPLCAITRAVPDRLFPSQYVRFVRMKCGDDFRTGILLSCGGLHVRSLFFFFLTSADFRPSSFPPPIGTFLDNISPVAIYDAGMMAYRRFQAEGTRWENLK